MKSNDIITALDTYYPILMNDTIRNHILLYEKMNKPFDSTFLLNNFYEQPQEIPITIDYKLKYREWDACFYVDLLLKTDKLYISLNNIFTKYKALCINLYIQNQPIKSFIQNEIKSLTDYPCVLTLKSDKKIDAIPYSKVKNYIKNCSYYRKEKSIAVIEYLSGIKLKKSTTLKELRSIQYDIDIGFCDIASIHNSTIRHHNNKVKNPWPKLLPDDIFIFNCRQKSDMKRWEKYYVP